MSKLKHLAAVLAVGGTLATGTVVTASTAQAEVLDFSLSVSNGTSETWTQTDPATVEGYGTGSSSVSISNRSGSFGVFTYVTYNNLNFNGGGFDVGRYVFLGPQIFSGTTSAPTFAPGTFNVTQNDTSYTGVLTITAVPEPATWTMMLTGVFGLGAVLRSRGKRLAAA